MKLPTACALVVLVCSAPAAAVTRWPAAGAPLCTAPGDQSGLAQLSNGCGAELPLWWVSRTPTADDIGYTVVLPVAYWWPCSGVPTRSVGIRELVLAHQAYGSDETSPGCFPYATSAPAWIEAFGAAERVVYASMGGARWIVDEGAAGPSGRSDLCAVGSVPLAPGDTSEVFLAWSDDRDGVPQVRAQRLGPSGTRLWGQHGVAIAPTAFAQRRPDAVRLADGSTVIVWEDERNGGVDVYAQHLMPGGERAPGWPAEGRALEARAEVASRPRFPRMSTWWAAWPRVVWEERGGRFGTGCSLVARGFDLNGEVDSSWPETGVVLTSGNAVEHLQSSFCDYAGGGLVVVWTDTRSATAENGCDLYAQRVDGAGRRFAGWPAAGLALCTAPGRQEDAVVDMDGNGLARFAWADRRDGTSRIYVSERRTDGSLPPGMWTANGQRAAYAEGNETAPVVQLAADGGMFVAWVDARNVAVSGLDVYGTTFVGSGGVLDAPVASAPVAMVRPPWPNPSRDRVRLSIELASATHVRLDVVDVSGRQVRALVDEDRPPGLHVWRWDGRDAEGRDVPPGLYFAVGAAGEQRWKRGMIRLR